MARETPKPAPERRVASFDEVRAAIEALSPIDLHRLLKFADFQVLKLRGKGGPNEGADLLNEAFERLLTESRTWNQKKVEFMGLLFGAMRSIADSWRTKVSTTERAVLFSSLLKENDDGEVYDPTQEFPCPVPDPSHLTLCKDTLEHINAMFANDQEGRMMLEGFIDQMTPPEIRDLWDWSKEKYNAVIVRMRRHLAKAGITDPTKESRHVQ
jgi:DNA-directed RNA polymerase specialized sigma24 family protein